MVRRTLRSSLWLLVVSLAVLPRPLAAQTSVGGVPVKTYTGYFDNTAVYFTAFESSSLAFAQGNGLVYAPRLSLANRAVVPDMIFFPNASPPQTVVLQTQPGRSDYSPIWEVLVASWRGAGKMPLITSYAQAAQYNRQGLLPVQRTNILFNGPVVWINMTLNRLGGRLAPTLSPNEFLGINPAQRTVYFRSHPAYYNGQQTAFLGLEHAAGVIQFAPGALPVPLIQTNYLGHNAIANLYAVQGQQIPVIDSIPQSTAVVTPVNPNPTTPVYTIAGKGKPVESPGTGQTGQQPVGGQTGQQPGGSTYGQPVGGATGQQPVGGATGQQPVGGQTGQQPVGGATGQQPVGGQTGQQPVGGESGQQAGTYPAGFSPYSALWHVHYVSFRPGVAPRLLRSVQEIQQALNLGWVTVQAGGVADVFNCPVITAPQPYNPLPGTGTNPYPGGTPVSPTPPPGSIPVTPTPPPGYGGY